MPQENVEMVRAALEAINRGDTDAAFKNAAPDFTFDLTRVIGTDRGVRAIVRICLFQDKAAALEAAGVSE
jgi:ketosteroid isomerase-like protein